MIRISGHFSIGMAKGLIAATVPLTTLFFAPISPAASPADTTSTHALLQARYELDLALIRDSPAARTNTAALVARLGRECHNVLAGEPKEEGFARAEASLTPRARGERELSRRQQQTISEEIGSALGAAEAAPDGGAIDSYAAATGPLSWSDPRIAPLVHAGAVRLKERLTVTPRDVCADIKTWAQSGYHLLSGASREFRAAQSQGHERIEAEGSLSALLKPSEGPAELGLLRRTNAIEKKLTVGLLKIVDAYTRLLRALGSPEGPGIQSRQAVLAHGKTRSGEMFTVRRESSMEPRGSSCRHRLSVEISESSHGSNGVSLSSSGMTVCLSSPDERRPSSSCGEGEVSIAVAVPESVRTVRLLLSDGSTIASGVVHIDRKDGGPGGVYVQAIRAERRHPVSLTELNRHGGVVRTLVLKTPPCKREPHGAGPTFASLVDGTVPGGQTFTIEGVLTRFGVHRAFNLTALVGGEGGGEESPGDTAIGRSGVKKAFPWSRLKGCPPRPFALLYGVLEAPGDSVLARTPEGLVPLTKLALAPELDSGGPLVYGAFTSTPSELIVRRSDGTVLYSESLATVANEDAEFCEGLAEG